MNRSRITSGVLIAILAFGNLSYGWNARGHMMVAGVAYNKLTQPTKARVNELLLLNPDVDNWLDMIPAGTLEPQKRMMLFMIAATWADRIKSNPDYVTDGPHSGNRPPNTPQASQNIGFDDLFRHKYWHFVDKPFSNDGTPLPAIPMPNALTQIVTFRAVLGSSTATDELKSYDLSWLLHLVGDVHQPLHATARVTATHREGDDGGNAVKLTSPSNLHTFWDGVLGTSEVLSPMITAISMLPTAPAAKVNDLTVEHWIDESFELAKSKVYKSPPIGPGTGPFTLTQTYKTAARTTANNQVALAGARMAKILNDELK